MNPRFIFFAMIIINLFWSCTYVLSKSVMTHYHPLEIGFLRYFFAMIPLLALMKVQQKTLLWTHPRVLLIGSTTFFLSPLCQMMGLHLSRAVDSSLLIALEPLLTVIGGAVLLNERVHWRTVFSIVFALVGVGMLTELTVDKLLSFKDARLIGNTIFILALLSEAGFTVISKPALEKHDPLAFVTSAIVIGVILLAGFNLFHDGPQRLAGLGPLARRILHDGAWSDLGVFSFLGFLCTAVGYWFWIRALKHTPVALLALTLYIQPVVGMVLGHTFLNEPITWMTLLGATFILIAVSMGVLGNECENS